MKLNGKDFKLKGLLVEKLNDNNENKVILKSDSEEVSFVILAPENMDVNVHNVYDALVKMASNGELTTESLTDGLVSFIE